MRLENARRRDLEKLKKIGAQQKKLREAAAYIDYVFDEWKKSDAATMQAWRESNAQYSCPQPRPSYQEQRLQREMTKFFREQNRLLDEQRPRMLDVAVRGRAAYPEFGGDAAHADAFEVALIDLLDAL